MRRVPARTFSVLLALHPAVAAAVGAIVLDQGLSLATSWPSRPWCAPRPARCARSRPRPRRSEEADGCPPDGPWNDASHVAGRFSVSVEPKLVAERFAVEVPEAAQRSFNVAPTQDVLAIVDGLEGRAARVLRWGLVPHWSTDARGAAKMINARAESLRDRSAFRSLLERKRVLVPADGFYEWRRDADGRKRPVRYTLAGGGLFAFAGLRAAWRDPATDEWLRSCTIVTTEANALVAPVHDRMPVILPREHEDVWLDPSVPVDVALDLLRPLDPALMALADVSPLVSNVDNDGPELLDPLFGTEPAAMTLF